MKIKYWQTTRFKELEKLWYQKLKKENFPDIEKQINGKRVLKQLSTNCYRNAPETVRETKQRYSELLAHAFHSELEFKDDLERLIMQRRAEGKKLREITEELKKRKEKFSNRWTVGKIIQKYELKWLVARKKRWIRTP